MKSAAWWESRATWVNPTDVIPPTIVYTAPLPTWQQHYAANVRIQTLASLADLSIAQLERHFRRVFLLTPHQVLNKLRIDAAMRHLQSDASIAAIGAACGFADQSAFARRFKATVGMTPRNYRELAASGTHVFGT